MSAMELAAAVRTRELSPVQVVDAHIARIQAVNRPLNAVVADRFAAAREEARAAEALLMRTSPADLPPLLGVPCTVKEFVAVAGQPHTAGIVARRHVRATEDATVVRRLKEAGAIVLGSTNAPEGGLWHETSNRVYGRTSNPWDLHRTPGGSSGGEGAILAAGGAPFGIGSDTGGSIRMPAAFCGIAGHKPTGGLVPTTGHYPTPPVDQLAALVLGPMARRATDLWPLLRIIAGDDGQDAQIRYRLQGEPAEVDWSRVRVVELPESRSPVRPEMRAAVHKAGMALVERGAERVQMDLPQLRRAFDAWVALLSMGPSTLDDLVSDGAGTRPWLQLLRFAMGRSRHTGGVLVLLLLERLLDRAPTDLGPLLELAGSLGQELDDALGPHGVLLHPPFPRTAPRHRGMALRRPWDVGCTTVFNVTESPVTVVPVDVDGKGLPIGVQIAAARGNDALTIAAGEVLEEAFGGWRRPVEPRFGPALPMGLRLTRHRAPMR